MATISPERKGELMKTALTAVHENGDKCAVREVMREVARRLSLTDYERERYEKTGNVRWESVLHFYTITCSKAGWLVRKKGIWYLTPEGVKALALSPLEMFTTAVRAYRDWRVSRDEMQEEETDKSTDDGETSSAYEQAIALARDEIRGRVRGLDAYEYQDIVAALLRGMGYHTPYVAPKGRDGGIDILAYRDPFGTEVPRIKVQVKHRQDKATVQEIRQLSGLLNKDGDTGLFVSSSGFTTDAENAVRTAPRHIETMDLDNLVDLWEQFYDRMTEEDRALLPLRRVAFLAPEE